MQSAGFQDQFAIGDRQIGGGAPCLFIAEAGVAHFGDMDLAIQLVELAAEAGADVFKTQVFDVDQLIAAELMEWRDRLRPRNLSLPEFKELKTLCDERGLLFMATAHNESRIPWLEELDVPAIKVGSGERGNPGFLTRLAELGRPMLVSTGMYDERDVEEALDACAKGGCDQVALLHCITAYPTPSDQVNLMAMDRLAEIFDGPVGYSDHTEDHLAILSAVARGAEVVEKHITILRDVPNAQDWKVSAGPEDLGNLIADIRRLEAMLGHGRKEAADVEQEGRVWATKSVVATRDLPADTVLGPDDLITKRPGTGIPANQLDQMIGRTLARAVAADTLLQMDDLA
ncbi:MAG: N-acylneuraminate-9-phosphate synthase [Rhodospirillaceae bacterium]|jgi:N,N'-diacetyllegionaminate synthase|nr:N-acylneuraminate-9-phosphate synthase [Rhodospirillaceae bacterium]MBT5194353.1 N-acylneuraminate-9-phosphate synthase [Rhodospirillaceae bacterium]MBT5897100.1 N-acylneuraminate-9-phosphate synthase [Rhodospirillaceae bacterium]MBT6427590.1 N-acylneuraminate-9-phosphate synthase [Rhodospirillaceae bacterium]MBT7760715.1 N-acylneuraminate-9-phosphate synthase [Rhodospirillaceae bacterium]